MWQCLRGAASRGHGRAVQVDPVKPILKPTGTERLKLNSDVPLSPFAFKFNLRRYTTAASRTASSSRSAGEVAATRTHKIILMIDKVPEDIFRPLLKFF